MNNNNNSEKNGNDSGSVRRRVSAERTDTSGAPMPDNERNSRRVPPDLRTENAADIHRSSPITANASPDSGGGAGAQEKRTPQKPRQPRAARPKVSAVRSSRAPGGDADNNQGSTRVINISGAEGNQHSPRSATHQDAPNTGNQSQRALSRANHVGAVRSAAKQDEGAKPRTLSRRDERSALSKRARRHSGKHVSANGSSVISSALKAVIYIAAVLVISGFLSYFGITVGNDVFAFVKSDREISVTIPEYASLGDISEILHENGVIRYPTIFKMYAKLRKFNLEFLQGEYTVTPSMNYDSLLRAFKEKKKERTEVSVTIPEGYNIDDIITLMVDEYGIGTRDGYKDAIQNYDFDFWFVDELSDLPQGRKYRLEGYLYPDTYYFFSDSSEEAVIYKMLSNFNSKFTDEYKARCEELNMTVDQIVTLASMIQMEAKFDTEFADISSVFHNRINNPSATNGKLESDATIQYVLSEHTEDLTAEDLSMDNPYNTYMYKGLPPSAISNPTLVAINYALHPSNSNYYYFVAQPNGYSLFAQTLAQHNANKAAVKNMQNTQNMQR